MASSIKLTKCKLGDFASVHSGYAFKSSEFQDEGIPVIKIKNVRKGFVDLSDVQYVDEKYLSLDDKYHVKGGDILVSLTGSHLTQPDSVVGRVALHRASQGLCLLNQRAGKVVIEDPAKCNDRYLFYVLSQEESSRAIALMAHGAANQANVSPTQVESLEIELPSLSVQQKIAIILSAHDDLIENNERRIKILEEMAETIYKEWFISFRLPGQVKSKKNKSDCGLMPEGWEVRALRDVISLEYGKGLTAKKREPGSIPVYGSSGIVGYHNEYLVEGPGIVVGRAGNAGYIHWAYEKFFPVDSTFYVKITNKKLNLYYLYYFLKHSNLKQLVSGAAVPGLNRNAVYAKKIVIPLDGSLELFKKYISTLFDKMYNLAKINDNLRKTRDLLLSKLISGEIDVEGLNIDTEQQEELI